MPRHFWYSITDFLPLLLLSLIIILFTVIKQLIYGLHWHTAMTDFMGFFFVIFGFFKLIRLNSFVQAYGEYDLITQLFRPYGYVYPLIELSLGICFLIRYELQIITIITVILMSISALSVAYALRKGQTLQCACIGTVFTIPMTYVTLAEDLLMVFMSLIMLLMSQ